MKKQLVDNREIVITQEKMNLYLYNLLKKYGYGSEFFFRYRLMSSFFRERIPLIILISGTGCLNKKLIATKLANQLNLPNVLHTSLVTEVMSKFTFFI